MAFQISKNLAHCGQLTLRLPKESITDQQLLKISSLNRDLQFERSAQDELIISPPENGTKSIQNANLTYQLYVWWREHKRGKIYDSSGGFSLPDGAVLAPDAAWVSAERLANLTKEELESYPPVCPDFVIELRSNTDSLSELKEKMQQYIENGAKLGWLIDPKSKKVFVYTADGVEEFDNPETVSAQPVLDFELDMLELY